MTEAEKFLPGHNCGACGYTRCDEFAGALLKGRASYSECTVLRQERYRANRESLARMVPDTTHRPGPNPSGADAADIRPAGLIDGYEADFILFPMKGEASCREILLQIGSDRGAVGDVVRYRPLGCPITHFARIIEKRDGLLVVHIVGPRHRLEDPRFTFMDVGLCMVIGFEGIVDGPLPSVGKTVRFIPAGCMMQKVHSAVVVKCEGRAVLLEGLDLKVWAPPVEARER